eukprot:2173295-Alexandrium_andersonii.AAC.1
MSFEDANRPAREDSCDVLAFRSPPATIGNSGQARSSCAMAAVSSSVFAYRLPSWSVAHP